MKVSEFLENFRYVAEAPGGVMQLRTMVLHLAMTGELTQQRPGDTPVALSFSRNQEHRAELARRGKLGRQKPLPGVAEASCPWQLPEAWRWCRLGEVTSYGSTEKADVRDVGPDTWVVELEDIEKNTSRLIQRNRVSNRAFRSAKNRFKCGDVLYGKLRPYLDKVLLADADGVCTTEIMPITPFSGVDPSYLRWFLKSAYFKTYATESTHGMNLPRLGTEPARAALFPFAPEEEQQRIVAKVDELMALCEKLEAQQRERRKRATSISSRLHTEFAMSPTTVVLDELLRGKLPASPNDLRQAVLTLAVKGALCSRKMGEDAAHELIERIRQQKSGSDQYPPVRDEEKEFPIPYHWAWERLGNLTLRSDAGWSPKCHPTQRVGDGWGVLKVSAVSWGVFRPDENKALPNHLDGRPDYEVKDGDFLISRANTADLVARSVIVRDPPPHLMLSDKIVRFEVPDGLDSDYLNLANSSPWARKFYAENATGTSSSMKNVSRTTIAHLPVPVPPLAEQREIVRRVSGLFATIRELESQQLERESISSRYAEAAVVVITGTISQESKPMKAPQTELVTRLEVAARSENPGSEEPLAALLAEENGPLSAKELWRRSGLAIEAFYQQLKTEQAAGWIIEPEPARMREVKAE